MGKAVLIIIAASVVGGTILMNAANRTALGTDQRNSEYEAEVIARGIAESALNMAVNRAKLDFANAEDISYADEPYGDGTYDVTTTRLSASSVEIEATGYYEGADGSVTGEYTVSTTLVLASPLDAAIVVEAPRAAASFAGTNFFVSGLDTAPDAEEPGEGGNGYHIDGIMANLSSVRDEFRVGLGGERVSRVVGVEGDGDIVSGDFEMDMQDLYQEAKARRDHTIEGGTISGTVSYGTPGDPQIVVISDDVTVSGHFTGVGMLVVDGDVSVAGQFSWEGIVMAKQEEASLHATLGGNASIHGSMILLQGSSAFTMPTDGRVRVTYLSSSASYQSAVYIEPYGEDADQIFPPGANRNGDQMEVYEQVFDEGTQMSFFIRTNDGSHTYDHYARGHESPEGQPYAIVTQTGPYTWRIAYEDIDTQYATPDWDYNDQIIEVEVIPAEGGSDDGGFEQWWSEPMFNTDFDPTLLDVEPQINLAGFSPDALFQPIVDLFEQLGREDGGDKVDVCHIPPGNPANAHTINISENAVPAHLAHGDYLGACNDDQVGDDDDDSGDDGSGLDDDGGSDDGGSGVDDDDGSGDDEGSDGLDDESDDDGSGASCGSATQQLCFSMGGNAAVVYNSEAIARLAGRLENIRNATRIVETDRWVR